MKFHTTLLNENRTSSISIQNVACHSSHKPRAGLIFMGVSYNIIPLFKYPPDILLYNRNPPDILLYNRLSPGYNIL